jgi:tetratricopeptide (TPR) repeat protein
MVKAEQAYRAALDHPDATAAQKSRARFYLAASLGRQGKLKEAVELQNEWLKRNPKDKSRHYVLFFHGIYLWELGHQEKARECWRKIVRQAPDSQIAGYAAQKLRDGHRVRRRARPDPGYQPGRRLAADAGRPGGYLVVAVATNRAFRQVAEKAAAFHEGSVIDFDGRDFDGLRKRLAQAKPRNVLYVVPPDVLDVNLHRRLLLLSGGLDDDIFPDFAFGYLTARDAKAVAALWERTVQLHRNGPVSKRWIRTAVRRAKPYVSRFTIDDLARAAGFTGDAVYWGTEGTREEKLAFVQKNLRLLEAAAVIAMTGCGDPQGTWLFADSRNAERDKHWDFDPEKVGHDPDGEMPRITADHIRKLRLRMSPIVFTGVCHAGATRRVFVEGDIVSTFGRTKGISTLYELDPDESYCLAIIDAGAVAYFCPIGANHGASVGRETTFLLTEGASLGETIKSTYDELYLASRGNLVLDIQKEGEAHRGTEYVMQGGGANRILIGDPALKPYPPTHHPKESVEIRNRTDKGFEVVVTWEKGYHTRAWDMYREDSRRDWCVRARIDLDGLVPKQAVAITAQVHATGLDGRPLPYVMTHAEPETHHGRRFLHLQATAPRKPVAYKHVQAVFRVTFE